MTLSDTTDTLLYVFSPKWGYCRLNTANVQRLFKFHKRRVEVLSISISAVGLSEYLTRYPIPGRIYIIDSPEAIARWHFGITPQLALIDHSRKIVVRVWQGAWSPSIQRDLEQRFAVKLPGLTSMAAQCPNAGHLELLCRFRTKRNPATWG